MIPTPPEGFRHYTPMTIRFADLDSLRHVNNAKYLTYIETARLAYVAEVCGARSIDQVPMILAKITVEFKLPLMLGDQIGLFTRCSRIGNRSFDLETVILRYQDDSAEVAAVGQQVMVAYDYGTGQSMPVPDDWRVLITRYEPALGG